MAILPSVVEGSGVGQVDVPAAHKIASFVRHCTYNTMQMSYNCTLKASLVIYYFLEARSRRLPLQGRAARPRPSLRILQEINI